MTLTKHLSNVTVKDAAEGTVSAVFSVFGNVDSDGDVLVKGAFTSGANVVLSAYGHGSWDGALPVGKGTIRETATEAVFEGKFFMDTTGGRDTFETVRQLSEAGLQEWSYSLENVVAHAGEVDGRSVRMITKVDVKEVSPVLRGANPLTRTLAVKDRNVVQLPADVLARSLELLAEHEAREAAARREFKELCHRFQLAELKRQIAEYEFASAVDAMERRGPALVRCHYSEAPEPSAEIVAAALEARKQCAVELGVALPRIVWVKRETDWEACHAMWWGHRDWPHLVAERPIWGAWHGHSQTMLLLASLDAATVRSTVAHEMRHAAGGDEAAAQEYERAFVKRTGLIGTRRWRIVADGEDELLSGPERACADVQLIDDEKEL